MVINLYVNNQILSISPAQQNVKVVADSKNYLKVAFLFQTPEWKQGNLLYALFTYKGKTYKKILGIEEGTKWNECFVASEVLKEGKFSVAVFADNLITTNSVDIPVLKSGYTDKIENQEATPSVLEQMNSLMSKYAYICNNILQDCEKIERRVNK